MYIDHGTYLELNGAYIPLDIDNADFRAFEDWVALGNTPELPPAPTQAFLIERAKAEMRVQRQPIISVLDGLQASALALGNTERAQAIETGKQGLRDITSTDLSACTTYEEMRLTVIAVYYALAAALPLDVRQAFSDALK
jgi:hypothetical protein